MEALLAAQKLLGCFRQGDANDPVVYGSAIAAVLSQYSREVVEYVCHPFTGLPGNSSVWMPGVCEVKAACEQRAVWEAKVERYRKWGKAAIEAQTIAIAGPKEVRPTREELLEKYGKGWGLDDEIPQLTRAGHAVITAVALNDHYAVYRLGFEKRTAASTSGTVGEPAWDGATESTLTKMRKFKRFAKWVVRRMHRI